MDGTPIDPARPPSALTGAALAVAIGLLLLAGCAPTPEETWEQAQKAWSHREPHARALWLAVKGDSPQGREARDRLAEADLLYLEGLARLEAGDPDARGSFEAAMALGPIDPRHYLRMARAYADLGYPERAARYYGRFLQVLPDDPEAEVARAERRALGVPADLLELPTEPVGPEEARPRSLHAAVGATALLGVVLGALLWVRRREKARLGSLVARQPELQPAIAYLVGSLRHELLKHRVGAAAAVLQASTAGETSTAQRAFFEDRLFAEPNVAEAWEAHLDAFSRVLAGRLDVRRDPHFRAADRALGELAAAERLLTTDLARAHRVIARSYRSLLAFDRGLARLVEHLETAHLDHGLLLSLCREVRSEVLAGAVTLDAIEIPRTLASKPVRLSDADLRLVLKNLVRNAVLACAEADTKRVAVVVDEELEPTGEEVVVVRVLDTGATVGNRELRGRDLQTGLGLVSSVLERNGGSLRVESAPPPYAKAVALRLFRAYPESREAA